MNLESIAKEIAAYGLMVRGGFRPKPSDGVPGDPGTLVLVGNAGPAMWKAFSATGAAGNDPLDAWTREVLFGIAARLDATALFPFTGPPYLPFQRWAMRADRVFSSPIGPLIHPRYGLWHAYRGALAFAEPMNLPAPEPAAHPCESCSEKPCLNTCPVSALVPGGYDVPACTDHMVQPAGTGCLNSGCAARRACPVGRKYIYPPAQAGFHMKHFLDGNHAAPG